MFELLTRWFVLPQDGHPADVLRWTRRVNLAMLPLVIGFIAMRWSGRSWFPWVLVGALAYAACAALTLGHAIRIAEQRGPLSAAERAAGERRVQIARQLIPPLFAVAFFVVGYASGGLAAGLVLLAFGLLISTAGSWMNRRLRLGQPSGAGPPATTGQAAEATPAGPGQRFLAWILDAMILSVVLTPLNPSLYSPAPGDKLSMVMFGATVIIAFAYLIAFDGDQRGATPGKRIVGIRVVDTRTKQPIGYRRATLRRLGYAFGGLALGLGWLWLLIDPQRQAWHDKLASTIVIRTR